MQWRPVAEAAAARLQVAAVVATTAAEDDAAAMRQAAEAAAISRVAVEEAQAVEAAKEKLWVEVEAVAVAATAKMAAMNNVNAN